MSARPQKRPGQPPRARRRLASAAPALALATLASSAVAYDDEGHYAVWGPGRQSCHTYLDARDRGEDAPYRTFLEGYLSAYNSFTPDTYRVSGELGMDALLERLDAECEAHPIASFELALRRLVQSLAPHRTRSAPSRRRGGWSW